MYALTKMDIAALRQADYLYVSLIADKQRVCATKRVERTDSNPFARDIDYDIAAPVAWYGYGVEPNPRFTELVYLYRGQHNHAASVVAMLKVGDEISFEFYPDAHSNGYLKDTGLHADSLRLHIQRDKARLVFELASSICPETSARMCQNASRPKEYSLA